MTKLHKDIKLSVITCTGNRLEAFELCKLWMSRQRYIASQKPQWIVVDDGEVAIDEKKLQSTHKEKFDITYIRQQQLWKPGKNTQRKNLIAGLNAVRGNVVAIIEDDDYYKPDYLARMIYHLWMQQASAVGEGNALYYHLPTRSHTRMGNFASASLCQTVFTAVVIPLLIEAANSGDLYFDIYFWTRLLARHHKVIMYGNTDLCVAIKGMPGRGNITARDNAVQNYTHDDNLAFLRHTLQADAEYYLPYVGHSETMQGARVQSIMKV